MKSKKIGIIIFLMFIEVTGFPFKLAYLCQEGNYELNAKIPNLNHNHESDNELKKKSPSQQVKSYMKEEAKNKKIDTKLFVETLKDKFD